MDILFDGMSLRGEYGTGLVSSVGDSAGLYKVYKDVKFDGGADSKVKMEVIWVPYFDPLKDLYTSILTFLTFK